MLNRNNLLRLVLLASIFAMNHAYADNNSCTDGSGNTISDCYILRAPMQVFSTINPPNTNADFLFWSHILHDPTDSTNTRLYQPTNVNVLSTTASGNLWSSSQWSCAINNCLDTLPTQNYSYKVALDASGNPQYLQVLDGTRPVIQMPVPSTQTARPWLCNVVQATENSQTVNAFRCYIQPEHNLVSTVWKCPTMNTSTCTVAANQAIGICSGGTYFSGTQNYSDKTTVTLSTSTTPATPAVVAYFDGAKTIPSNVTINGLSYYDKFDGGFWCVYRDPNYATSGFQAFASFNFNNNPNYANNDNCTWDGTNLTCTPQ